MTNFEKIKQMDVDQAAVTIAEINNMIFKSYIEAASNKAAVDALTEAVRMILTAEAGNEGTSQGGN